MSKIKERILSTIIILISTISTIILLEFVLRTLNKTDDWSVLYDAYILRNVEIDYQLRGLYDAEEQTFKYKRNEYGLRDDCDNSSNIKVLTVGGSTTAQVAVRFDATYQKILQNRLRQEIGQFGCVTNAGIDGHSTWGHIFAFEKWFPLIPNLKPDYVVLYVGINDADFVRSSSVNHDLIDSDNIKGWLNRLEIVNQLMPIYRFIQHNLNKELNIVHQGHFQKPYTTEDYVVRELHRDTEHIAKKNAVAFGARFEKIMHLVKNMGATPICVTQPHIYIRKIDGEIKGVKNVFRDVYSGLDYDYSLRRINTIMADLCGDMLLDLYNHQFLPNEHFYDGIHTNDIGSIYLGNLIADFFIEKNLHTQMIK